jgi:hypothetical protein
MRCFADGARFRLVRGTKASFLHIDVVQDGRWVEAGQRSWPFSPEEPLELIDAVRLINERFAAQQLLNHGESLLGDTEAFNTWLCGGESAIEAKAEAV